MATATRTIGPADAGRRMTWAEYKSVTGQEGFRYELIKGRLVVFPAPGRRHARVWKWIYDWLNRYSQSHPEVINYLIPGSCVFIEGDIAPEPDLCAYHNYPLDANEENAPWEDVNPMLVVEILSSDNAEKDLVRNVELYLAVPSISEYWIFDPRNGLENTTMRVYRRRGQRWHRPIDLGPGDTYTTKLLPGFSLLIDPLA